jgi:hypothetical protein
MHTLFRNLQRREYISCGDNAECAYSVTEFIWKVTAVTVIVFMLPMFK